MSNNTRQPAGRRSASRKTSSESSTTYQWTADSDWLRPPGGDVDRPGPAAPPLRRSRLAQRSAPDESASAVAAPAVGSAGPRPDPGHQSRWFDELLPEGYDVDPHDDDRTTVTPTLEELFAPEFDALGPDALGGEQYHDDVLFAVSRLDRVRRRLNRRVLAAVAAIVVAVGSAAYFLRSDDGGSGDLAAVALPISTTALQPATVGEPGADTVRTGPGLLGAPDDDADPGSIGDDAGAVDQEAGEAADGSTDPGADAADPAASASGNGDGAAAGGSPAGSPAPDGSATGGPAVSGDYGSNLALIQNQTVRNRNEDDSPYRQTPSSQLVPENHYGPRSDYLQVVDGNVEPSFPVQYGGQFRVACEFSHFAYDDPLVYPNQPGASHLHMFFGNTDTNAFSTADTIKNSGGGTCNGSELNRTGYWVPAMFDGKGNVRVPERIVIYYKGEGLANGNAEVFPEGAAMIASVDLNTIDPAQGGAAGKFSFNCADNYSGFDSNLSNTMPSCAGTSTPAGDMYSVMEVNVKFPQCWNGQDAGNPANFRHPTRASWYGSLCEGEYNRTLVNLEYFVNYRVEPGESTDGWFFSSDVSPTERVLAQTPGSTNHGDWWSGWHNETNKMFIDNCVNFSTSVPSGCGFGYLTDGGPDGNNPKPGPALKLRDQYLGPLKVKATDLHAELCPGAGPLSSPTAAAFCNPAAALATTSAPGGEPPAHSPAALFCPVHRGMLASDPASPLSGGAG